MSQRFKVQLKRYGRSFAIVAAVMAIGLAAGFYILIKQRLPNPFQSLYSVNGAFPTAAAVVPGLGEPVNVAGVHVGEITDTELKNGQGIIKMQIDPSRGVPHLFCDAHASLVPNTPLKDMQVDINPGTPGPCILPHGATIPVAQTTSPIDSDELLDSLDADTRTWFTSLITELNNGTQGRGKDIRALLMNLGPTAAQLHTVTHLLAVRRVKLALLVHNLGQLTQATANTDGQLTQFVRAGNTTVQALASQSAALQSAIHQLPTTLSLTQTTLSDLTTFSNQLAPTATGLIPVVKALPNTLNDAKYLVQGAALIPASKIQAFENAVLPLAKLLPSTQSALNQSVPNLTSTFKILTYVTNELAYKPSSTNPGFLYWLGWFAHNVDSFLATSDGNGPAWSTEILTSCQSLNGSSFGPLLKLLLGTTFGC
jgi:phospholipid/cholesterol/gamma-HCH transport system substrate-binding protein